MWPGTLTLSNFTVTFLIALVLFIQEKLSMLQRKREDLMQTVSRQVTYTETFDYAEGNSSVLISTPSQIYFIKKSDWTLLHSLKEKRKKEDILFKAIFQNTLKKYYIYDDDYYEKVASEGITQRILEITRHGYTFPENWRELEDKMVHFDWNSHLWFDLNDSLMPRAYVQNYIGGITDQDYNLAKAAEILDYHKKEGIVLSHKVEPIPYYNQEKDRNQSISFVWRLPKERYNEIYNSFKKKDYPSVHLKECWKKEFGLEEALKKESEVNN